MRAGQSAAQSVLRRSARAHASLARRRHAGHAHRPARTPIASRAASRSASDRTTPTGRSLRICGSSGRSTSRPSPTTASCSARSRICSHAAVPGLRVVHVPALPSLATPRLLPDERPRHRRAAAQPLLVLRIDRTSTASKPRRGRGRRSSPPPRKRTTARASAASRRSSATSGPAAPAATTCIATCIFARRGRAGAADQLLRSADARGALGAARAPLHAAARHVRSARHPAQLEPERRPHVHVTRRSTARRSPPSKRRRWRALEPLVEVMQHKGDSECGPGLGPTSSAASRSSPTPNFREVRMVGAPGAAADELRARRAAGGTGATIVRWASTRFASA